MKFMFLIPVREVFDRNFTLYVQNQYRENRKHYLRVKKICFQAGVANGVFYASLVWCALLFIILLPFLYV